jgi:hypothetical protein
VESAARRVFLTKAKETPALDRKVSWGRFIPEQLKTVESRFGLGTEIKGKRSALHLLILCVLAAALIGAFYKWTNPKRIIAASLFLSGPLWLIPMRGFTAYHLYASMMYFGIPMVAYGAVLLFTPRRLGAPALIAVFLVFNYLNVNVNQLKNRSTLAQVTMTEDFQAIHGKLVKGDLVYYDGGFRKLLKNSPYAVGYYLRDQHV